MQCLDNHPLVSVQRINPYPVVSPHRQKCLTLIQKKDTNLCGSQCELRTKCDQITPCRASWTVPTHPPQEQLNIISCLSVLHQLQYNLDIEKPETELIVKTQKGCLTRGDFWTLGLNNEMESNIGNACFQLIEQIAQSKVITNTVYFYLFISFLIWV